MYDILVVDDDLFTLALLEETLKDYGDFFTPVYANTGKEAVDILTHEDIALLVTDLVMPGDINGWHLIEYIESFHPQIPIVVITGCTEEEKLEELQSKVQKILLKPVRVHQLVKTIISILNKDISNGSLKGVSVGSFLQLLEMDEKTCLLEVGISQNKKGLLYVNQGKLYDAEYGNLRGIEAACSLVSLHDVKFRIKELPRIEIQRRIKMELMTIIAKAKKQQKKLRQQDTPQKIQQLDDEEHTIEEQQAEAIISPTKPKVVQMEELENILHGLCGIKGYRASALMNFTGEILVTDSLDSKVDLENIGPVFNDVFRTAEENTVQTKMGNCNELILKTSDSLIVMCCSGLEATVHLHILAVLDRDGNQALTKIQLARIIPLMIEQLES